MNSLQDRSIKGSKASKQAPIPNSVSAKWQKERFQRRLESDIRYWAGAESTIRRMLAKGEEPA